MHETDLFVDTLRKLSETDSPSGHEALGELLHSAFAPIADEIYTDALGSVFARARAFLPAEAAPAPTLMLAAHTDEIGMSVSRVKDGFLQVEAVGGIDPATLLGREVRVHAAGGPLPGIIATIPPHLTDASDRRKVPRVRDLFVDVGLDAPALAARVRAGDRITLKQPLARLLGERVAGKALDDRAGVLTLIETLRLLRGRRAALDVVAVCTVQEEVGLRGAITSAFGLNPDLAIAVDVGFADQPDLSERETITLGGGPAIGIGPSLHPGMRKRLLEVARQHHIKHQIELVSGYSGTDAWAIEVARGSVPCALLSLPLRHMHSTSELLDLRDVQETARLIAEFAGDFDAQSIEEWQHAAF